MSKDIKMAILSKGGLEKIVNKLKNLLSKS